MSISKTNAMRILDKSKIKYEIVTYDISDGKIDGISVSEKTGQDPERVYKTLVVEGTSKEIYVFVIPVCSELNLKKAANISGEKKVEMIQVKDITKITNYVRGGCSPIGMKKLYKTYIFNGAKNFDYIFVSGGKKGIQIKLNPNDLIDVTKAMYEDIIQK